jgi:hypothetical protein
VYMNEFQLFYTITFLNFFAITLLYHLTYEVILGAISTNDKQNTTHTIANFIEFFSIFLA